jgi:hypothetical protein
VIVAGGTEVIAGIRLEVGDVDPGMGKGKGKEGWRGKVEVDVYVQLDRYGHCEERAYGFVDHLRLILRCQVKHYKHWERNTQR